MLAAQRVGIDKLDLKLLTGDGESFHWSVDDPPETEINGRGPIKIFGLEVAGSDDGPQW